MATENQSRPGDEKDVVKPLDSTRPIQPMDSTRPIQPPDSTRPIQPADKRGPIVGGAAAPHDGQAVTAKDSTRPIIDPQ
ncbi:laminin G [Streptomyces lydicus]|uniref:laminin G n=1 Tax=Streptomyces lydicus TaxID=47763 RepID=UPI0036A9F7F9